MQALGIDKPCELLLQRPPALRLAPPQAQAHSAQEVHRQQKPRMRRITAQQAAATARTPLQPQARSLQASDGALPCGCRPSSQKTLLLRLTELQPAQKLRTATLEQGLSAHHPAISEETRLKRHCSMSLQSLHIMRMQLQQRQPRVRLPKTGLASRRRIKRPTAPSPGAGSTQCSAAALAALQPSE